MASTDSRVSAWKDIVNDAALDNINRFLAGTDQPGSSTRRQRLPRDPSNSGGNIVTPISVTEGSNRPRNVHGSFIGKGSVASSQISVPVSYATAHTNQSTAGQSPSSPSIISKEKDSRDLNHVNRSIPPHLRVGLSKAGSQNSTKNDLIASIHSYSDVATTRVSSTKHSTKSQYGELIDAQQRFPTTPTEQHHHSKSTRYSSKPSETTISYASPVPDLSHLSRPTLNDEQPHQTTSKPMNSGTAAKSAKIDAKYPCSYEGCGMGFTSNADLSEHKYTEHEGWCKTCDIDTEDDQALLAHKMSSLRHICCQFCGKDFHGEAARNIHEERTHGPKTDVKCIGCQMLFDSGSALIKHIYSNKCRDPRGQVREKTIRENRVIAALSFDKMAHENASSMTWGSQTESIAGESSVGGVPVQSSLLDSEVPPHRRRAQEKSLIDGSSSVFDDFDDAASRITARSDRTAMDEEDFPPLGSGQDRCRKPTRSVVQGLESLNIASSVHQKPATKSMARRLFGDAQVTPAAGRWSASESRSRRTSSYSASQVGDNEKKSDWDHLRFEKDNITGQWKCPFEACTMRYNYIESLINHLQSGYHHGTDNTCAKCLKKFKEVHHLIAHMESDSIKCGIKWSRRYGHLLHIVSGGFLGVDRDEDGRPLIREVDEPTPEVSVDIDEDDFRSPLYGAW